MADPSGFLTNPPSTVVKVVNTARQDLNGQLGIAIDFQQERGRYLVLNVTTQQTLALKPENLVKGSSFETAKAQFLHIKNSPQVQQKLRDFYEQAKRRLHPVKPEYAAVGLLVVFLGLIYIIGFTRVLMLMSLVLLVGVVTAPDIIEGASPSQILRNFPRRSRECMEQSFPFLQGKLSDNMAMAVVVIMMVMAIKSMLPVSATPPPRVATQEAQPPHTTVSPPKDFEQYYKLGFDDATKGLDYGTSMPDKPTPRSLGVDSDFDNTFDSTYAPPPTQGRSFGMSGIMSCFYLARTLSQMAHDPVNGGYSVPTLVANLKVMQPMTMGMMAFSLYNVVKSLGVI